MLECCERRGFSRESKGLLQGEPNPCALCAQMIDARRRGGGVLRHLLGRDHFLALQTMVQLVPKASSSKWLHAEISFRSRPKAFFSSIKLVLVNERPAGPARSGARFRSAHRLVAKRQYFRQDIAAVNLSGMAQRLSLLGRSSCSPDVPPPATRGVTSGSAREPKLLRTCHGQRRRHIPGP